MRFMPSKDFYLLLLTVVIASVVRLSRLAPPVVVESHKNL
jgi:hypothetical protein